MESRWAVIAVRHPGGQLPTFFLDSSVQGIVSREHATRVALDIVGPCTQVHVEPV
jgi:hypothetical protein